LHKRVLGGLTHFLHVLKQRVVLVDLLDDLEQGFENILAFLAEIRNVPIFKASRQHFGLQEHSSHLLLLSFVFLLLVFLTVFSDVDQIE
jgi:hypothetical protein